MLDIQAFFGQKLISKTTSLTILSRILVKMTYIVWNILMYQFTSAVYFLNPLNDNFYKNVLKSAKTHKKDNFKEFVGLLSI